MENSAEKFLPSNLSIGGSYLLAQDSIYNSKDSGFKGFAKRQIVARVSSVALPVLFALDTVYHTLSLAIKFTANVISLGALARNFASFGTKSMFRHMKNIFKSAVATTFSLPIALLTPSLAYSLFAKDRDKDAGKGDTGKGIEKKKKVVDFSKFTERPYDDPYSLLEQQMLTLEGGSLDEIAPYEEIQKSKDSLKSKNPLFSQLEDKLSEGLDLKMAGHILGDEFIRGTDGIEGNVFEKSIDYFLSQVDSVHQQGLEQDPLLSSGLDQKKLEGLITKLKDMRTLSSKITTIAYAKGSPVDFDRLVKGIQEDVASLSTGKSMLIPFGWSGTPSGHAMILEVKKEKSGYSMYVYNTGAGIDQNHPVKRHGKDLRYAPFIKYSGLDLEDLGSEFFSASLALQVKTVWDSSKEVGPDQIYDHLLAPLKSKKVKLSDDELFYIKGQRSGTCSYRCILAMTRKEMGSKKEYKKFKLDTGVSTLVRMSEKLEELSKVDVGAAREILEQGTNNMARLVQKLWNPLDLKHSTISNDDVRRIYTTLKHVRKSITAREEVPRHVDKDLSGLTAERFPAGFASLEHNLSGESSETRGCVRDVEASEIHSFITPTCFNEARAVLEKADTDCTKKFTYFGNKNEAIPIACNALLALPLPQEGSFWEWLSPEEVKFSMQKLQNITRSLAGANLENKSILPRHILAVNKAYLMMTFLAKKNDPSLEAYGVNIGNIVKLSSDCFTATPELSEAYLEMVGFANKHGKNEEKVSKSNNQEKYPLFAYEDIKENGISSAAVVKHSELSYLQSKAKDLVSESEKNAWVAREGISFRKVDNSTQKTAYLFINTDDAEGKEELFAYRALRDAYFMTQVIRGKGYFHRRDDLFDIELNKGRDGFQDGKVGVRISYSGDNQKHEIEKLNNAEMDAKVQRLFSREQRGEASGAIDKENLIPLQADLESENSLYKDVLSSIHDNSLALPMLLQKFQEEAYLQRLGEPSYQTMLFRELFKAGRITQQLRDEPAIAASMLKFVEKGIAHYSEHQGGRIQLQPALYFTHVASRFLSFIQRAKESNRAIAIDVDAERGQLMGKLGQWKERFDTPEERAAIELLQARIDFDRLPLEGEYSADDANTVLEIGKHFVSYQRQGTVTQLVSPFLEKEIGELFVLKNKPIAELFRNERFQNRYIDSILTLEGIDPTAIRRREVQFPIITLQLSNYNKVYINIVKGSVKTDQPTRCSVPYCFRKTDLYKQFFGEGVLKGGLLTEGISADMYEFNEVSSSLGKIRLKYKGGNCSIFREINGTWFENKSFDLKDAEFSGIPKVLLMGDIENQESGKKEPLFSHWIGEGEGSYILLSDPKSHEIKYEIVPEESRISSTKGELVEFTDDGFLSQIKEFANVPKEVLAKVLNGKLQELEFPLYRDSTNSALTFVRSEDGKMAWSSSPQYYIAEDQSFNGLGPSFHNYLKLENAEGKVKLLLPSLETQEQTRHFGCESALQLHGTNTKGKDDADIELKSNAYLVFNVSEADGETLIPLGSEGYVYLAYIALMKRDYSQAKACLQKTFSFDSYSATSREILLRIIELNSRNFDYTANGYSLRLYACYLLSKSMGSGTENRAKEEFFWEQCEDLYLDYLSHQHNCQTAFKFTRVLDNPSEDFAFLQKIIRNRAKTDGGYAKNASPQLLFHLTRFDPLVEEYDLDKVFETLPLQKDINWMKKVTNRTVAEVLGDMQFEHGNKAAVYIPFQNEFFPTKEEFFKNFPYFYDKGLKGKGKERKLALHRLSIVGFNKEEHPDLEAVRLFLLHRSEGKASDLPQRPKIAQQWWNNEKCNQFLISFTSNAVNKKGVISHVGYREAFRVFGEKLEEQKEELRESLPGKGDVLEYVNSIEERRATWQGALSLKEVVIPEASVVTLPSVEKTGFSQEQCERYFDVTERGSGEHRALVNPDRIPDGLSDYSRNRLTELEKDYEKGCELNASKKKFSFKEGMSSDDLMQSLSDKKAEDAAVMQREEQAILTLVNKGHSVWQREVRKQLQQNTALRERLSIEQCENLFALNDQKAFIRANPALEPAEADSIIAMIANYSVVKSRFQQNSRAIGWIKKREFIEGELQELEGDLSDAAELKREELCLSKVEAEQRLGQTLSAERVYNINEWRELLIFETRSNKMIWEGQFKLMRTMLSKTDEGKYREVIQQLIMGGGKTDVINIIQAFKKADGDQIAMLVVLQSLYNTNKNDFKQKSLDCFGQDSITVEYSRAAKHSNIGYLSQLYQGLSNARKKKQNVILPPASLHFLMHGYWEACDEIKTLLDTGSSEDNISEFYVKKNLLRNILGLVHNKGNITFDEPHKHFLATYEYNSPIGEGKPLPSKEIGFICDVMELITTKHSDLVDLRHSAQHLISEEKLTELKKRLEEDLLERFEKSRIVQGNREGFKAYISGDSDSEAARRFHAALSKYADSGQKNKMELLQQIVLSKRLLTGLLEDCFKGRRPGVHYGLSCNQTLNPDLEIVIPYSGNNRPQEQSRIADPYEMMIKTVASYFNVENKNESARGLSEAQTRKWLLSLQEKAQKEITYSAGDKTLNETRASREFEAFYGRPLFEVDCWSDIEVKAIRAEINNPGNERSAKAIASFLKTCVFPHVKIFSEQINTTAQDLGGLPKVGQGYSGTLENQKTFHSRYTTTNNPGTNGRTIETLLRDENSTVQRITKTDPTELLEELEASGETAYHSFIDIGAHFAGMGNREVSQSFLNYFAKDEDHKIKAVMYFEGDQLAVLKKGSDQPIYLKSSDPEAIKLQTELDPEQMFYYFDNSHTTGANLPVFWNAKAFATVNINTTKTEYLQGVMRLRGLGKKMSVTTLLSDKVHAIVSKKLKTEAPSISDIVMFTDINESEEQMKDNLRACLQKMNYVLRNKVMEKMLSATDDEDIEIYKRSRQVIIDQIESSPWKLFGSLHKDIPIEEFLTSKKQALLAVAKDVMDKVELSEFGAGLGGIIKEYEGSVPAMVQSPLCDANKTMEQQVEQEVEREEEEEKERSALSSLNALEQVEWKVEEDLYEGDHFSPIEASDENVNNKGQVEKGEAARIFRLKDVMRRDDELAEFSEVFSDNILISENLMRTINEHSLSLSGSYGKGVHQILAIQENNAWKFLLLSIEEAAFMKQKLLESKHQESSERKIWLLSPSGELTQSGRDSFDGVADGHSFKRGITQALLFKGDLYNLNQHTEELSEWQGQGDAVRGMLAKLIPDAARAEFPLSPTYNALQRVVEAA